MDHVAEGRVADLGRGPAAAIVVVVVGAAIAAAVYLMTLGDPTAAAGHCGGG